MIIPDLNILVHAYNSDFPLHATARQWWEQAAEGRYGAIGLAWVTILGFLRISTSRSILERPLPVLEAVAIVRSWLKQEAVRVLIPGERHGEILFGLLEDLGVAGNLTTDAHLAALALEYRAEVATSDTDFSRFAGLRWFNPLASRSRR